MSKRAITVLSRFWKPFDTSCATQTSWSLALLSFLKPAYCSDNQLFLLHSGRSLQAHNVKPIGLKDPRSDGGLLTFKSRIMLV